MKDLTSTNSLTALVAGGTSKIGRATANKLAKLGIHVPGEPPGYYGRDC